MDFEELFEECIADEKYLAPDDFINRSVNKMVENIEAEFTGAELVSAELDREREKAELDVKIKDAESRLKKIKNPPNIQKMNTVQREEITKKINEKRNKFRKEIALYELRLSEIEIEENKKSEEEEKDDDKNKKGKIKPKNKNNKSGASVGFSNGNSRGGNRSKNKLPKIRQQSETKSETSDNIFKKTWQNTNPYADI